MILGEIGSLGRYKSMIPFYEQLSEFLINNNYRVLANGKYEINGDDVYLVIQEYETKSETEKKWESHKKYIDIQIMIDGVEYVGHSPISDLKIIEPYNEERDVIFYKESQAENTCMVLRIENFCIFFPDDGHKPGCSVDKPRVVKKAVLKVKI
jgi:biofilm protein TabA